MIDESLNSLNEIRWKWTKQNKLVFVFFSHFYSLLFTWTFQYLSRIFTGKKEERFVAAFEPRNWLWDAWNQLCSVSASWTWQQGLTFTGFARRPHNCSRCLLLQSLVRVWENVISVRNSQSSLESVKRSAGKVSRDKGSRRYCQQCWSGPWGWTHHWM